MRVYIDNATVEVGSSIDGGRRVVRVELTVLDPTKDDLIELQENFHRVSRSEAFLVFKPPEPVMAYKPTDPTKPTADGPNAGTW